MVASSARLLCYRQHNDNVMWTAATVPLAAYEKVPSRGAYTVYNASIYHILHQLLHYMQRNIEEQACRLTTLVGRALLHNILSPFQRGLQQTCFSRRLADVQSWRHEVCSKWT